MILATLWIGLSFAGAGPDTLRPVDSLPPDRTSPVAPAATAVLADTLPSAAPSSDSASRIAADSQPEPSPPRQRSDSLSDSIHKAGIARAPATTGPAPDTAAIADRARLQKRTEKMLKGHGLFYFAVQRSSSAGNDPEYMEKNRKTIQGAMGYASDGVLQARVRPFSPFLAFAHLYSFSAGKTTTLKFREPFTDDSISSESEFLKGRKGLPMAGTARLSLALGPAFGWEDETFVACLRVGGLLDADSEFRNDAFIEDYIPYFKADFVAGYRIEPYCAWKKGPVPLSVTVTSNHPILAFGPFKNGLLEKEGLDWKCMLAANLFSGTGGGIRTDFFATYEHRRLPLSEELEYDTDRFSLDFRLGHLYLGAFFRDVGMDRYRERYAGKTRLEIREYGVRIGI